MKKKYNKIQFDIRLVVGESDVLAPIQQVQELATCFDIDYKVIADCGHSVPMESPRLWRQSVLNFINKHNV